MQTQEPVHNTDIEIVVSEWVSGCVAI